ncbi:pre-60S ribosomal particles component [Coniosporium apollinis]|uniref:Pre-60S ribosomal particles component n=1 Tax=Coniosporium apollinis TaxID=61459 RepID=A0ABQ9NKK7_9PEZI|nr:pre-60S ribosomal particles component [Coniosporium apollinis]
MPSKTPVALKRKRTQDGLRGKSKPKAKFSKRRRVEYHSSSDEDEPTAKEDFSAANLTDLGERSVREIQEEISKISQQEQEEEDEDEHETPTQLPDEGEGPVKKQNSKEVDLREADAEDAADPAHDENPVLSEEDEVSEEDDQDLTNASSASESETSTNAPSKKRKRNDPDAFATSMSKILGSKLTTSKRSDPILSRSKDASTASKELQDAKLEAKARHKIRQDKKDALEKGRVKDVMGLQTPGTPTAEIVEEERRLKKTAQRGVVKLFNAVRAAQVKGEEAAREAKKSGVVGVGKREERVNEMSKQGFLDLITGGGAKKMATPQEA